MAERVKRLQLAFLLLFVIGLSFYAIFITPVRQTIYPGGETVEGAGFTFSFLRLIIFLIIVIASVIIFAAHSKYGTSKDLEDKVLKSIERKRKGVSAYDVRNNLKKEHNMIGLQYNTIYRTMEKMRSEGKLKKIKGKYFVS